MYKLSRDVEFYGGSKQKLLYIFIYIPLVAISASTVRTNYSRACWKCHSGSVLNQVCLHFYFISFNLFKFYYHSSFLVDDPSIWEVVALAESAPINYSKTESNSLETCLHWYDVIVTITNRHGNYFLTFIEIAFYWSQFSKGIGISAVCNVIKCSLQLPYPVGYQRANRLIKMNSEADWDGDKHLPHRLEFSLLAGDFDKAGNMFSGIGNYKLK